jgi:putative ABC transport system permease protein
MKYLRLINLLTYNYFRKHITKILFAVIGMSTGIAIFVATNIYKETIYNDVSEKERLVQQPDEWLIKPENGRISEKSIREIINLKVFDKIAPKSQRVEYIYDNENKPIPVRFVGIDLLSVQNDNYEYDIFHTNGRKLDQIPVFGSNYFKKSEIVKLANPPTRNEIFVIDTIAESPKNSGLIVTDIAFYQELFDDKGWIDELGVAITESNPNEVQELIKQIDPKLSLISKNKYLAKKQSLSDAFLVNLQLFSLVALIISVLLIYQFYGFILIDRETDFAKLRSLGISSRDIKILLSIEIVFLGLTSSILGILGGLVLSKLSIKAITSTINTFYFGVDTNDVHLSYRLILISLFLGVTGCLLSGIPPIIRLIKSSRPSRILSHTAPANGPTRHSYIFILGLILLSILFMALNTISSIPRVLLTILTITLFTFGMFLIIPHSIIKLTSWIIDKKLVSPLKIKTAGSYIYKTLTRQSLFVLSLGILVGFVISLVIFISSFRQTIENWIYQLTPADLYIQSELNTMQKPFPLPEEVLEGVKNNPLVREFDTITRYEYDYENTPVQIRASDFELLREKKRLKFKSLAKDLSEIDKDWVLISEPFANRFDKGLNDEITIVGDRDTRKLKIMGIFYDYVTERGAIYIDKRLGNELYSKSFVNGISIYGLKPNERLELEQDIRRLYPSKNIQVEDQQQIRESTLSLFDKTFRIVWLLAGLAVIISIVTIINSTLMVYLERVYEFIQLRALGASNRQLFSIIWSQMSLLSLYSILIAFIFSLGFLNIIVKANNVFFGWTIDLILDWKPYLIALLMLFTLTYVTIKMTFKKLKSDMKLYNLRNE